MFSKANITNFSMIDCIRLLQLSGLFSYLIASQHVQPSWKACGPFYRIRLCTTHPRCHWKPLEHYDHRFRSPFIVLTVLLWRRVDSLPTKSMRPVGRAASIQYFSEIKDTLKTWLPQGLPTVTFSCRDNLISQRETGKAVPQFLPATSLANTLACVRFAVNSVHKLRCQIPMQERWQGYQSIIYYLLYGSCHSSSVPYALRKVGQLWQIQSNTWNSSLISWGNLRFGKRSEH